MVCEAAGDAGTNLYYCSITSGPCSGGRRPEGFVASRDRHRGPLGRVTPPVGAFFSNLAELEAASIEAFEILARELASHDAPLALQRAAKRSARDEVRHARITAVLARRHGGSANSASRCSSASSPRSSSRSLEAIAIENAVEGCVRETFGALIAMVQAEHAEDEIIRKAMRRIAEDETRHAELSWEIAKWTSSVLSAGSQTRVHDAMVAAIDDLANENTHAMHPDLVRVAGLPSPAVTTRMIAELRATLWSEASACGVAAA